MTGMTVKAYPVKDRRLREVHLDACARERLSSPDFPVLPGDTDLRALLISTVSLNYNPLDGLLYCGLTSFDQDILDVFDIDTKTFKSLDFQTIADKHDVKIHRSLEIDSQGSVYMAVAGLSDVDELQQAPGGKVVRYDPSTLTYDVLGIPLAHNYIQTIVLDERRGIIYGCTYPIPHAFRFDIATRTSKDLGFINSMPHSPALDDEGNLWVTWTPLGSTRNLLMRYNPDTDKSDWTRVALPAICANDTGAIDSVANGDDGYVYLGTTAGALLRLDPRKVQVDYLCHPTAGPRIAGLILGKDGLLYGSAGTEGHTYLFSYDRASGKSRVLGAIYDPERKTSNWTTHALCEPRPGLFYVGETDNPYRSGYLWECQVN